MSWRTSGSRPWTNTKRKAEDLDSVRKAEAGFQRFHWVLFLFSFGFLFIFVSWWRVHRCKAAHTIQPQDFGMMASLRGTQAAQLISVWVFSKFFGENVCVSPKSFSRILVRHATCLAAACESAAVHRAVDPTVLMGFSECEEDFDLSSFERGLVCLWSAQLSLLSNVKLFASAVWI